MRVVLIICLLLAMFPAQATIVIQANGATDQTTFLGNNVSAHVAHSADSGSSFFVGRNDGSLPAGGTQGIGDYAVSVAQEGSPVMLPYAPPTVRLDGVADQNNPVWGQKVSLLGLFGGSYGFSNPCVVTTANPQSIYWNVSNPGADPFDVFSITSVLDANGATTSGIAALAGARFVEATTVSQISGSFILAAVAAHGGTFGAPGSGIAMVGQGPNALVQQAAVSTSPSPLAVPLDGTQSYVKIVGDASVQANPAPDVHFSPFTQRAYAAFTVQTGAAAPDGARGIVVGYLNPLVVGQTMQYCLSLNDFAPAAAYAGLGRTAVGGLVTVGGAGAITGTYTKFRTLSTSTGLTYGIVLGFNAGAATNKTVSAVPLVNKSVNPLNTSWPTDPTQGAMASKIVNPGTNLQTFFNALFICKPYVGRGFQTPATTPADMPLFQEAPVWVGDNDAPGTNILDMQCYKDTVFVAVDNGAVGGQSAGIFASQALFDGNATIKGWTPWQRMASPSAAGNLIYGIGYQPSVGRMFTMEGPSATSIDTILTTTWNLPRGDGLLGGTSSAPQNGFVELINGQFNQGQGGIQAAFDFPANTPELSQAVGTRCSIMVFTGYQRIVLAQTSSDVANVLTPTVGDFSVGMQVSNDGSVVTPTGGQTTLISIGGGVLSTIGAVTSAALVSDGALKNYLVVGGVGGVAVLSPGWPIGGLQAHFADLPPSSFTMIGSYKNVRTLWSDGTNLYVLTNQTFDRIPVSQLSGTTITPVTLATPVRMGLSAYAQFSDVVVSAKVALLATSQGLFTTGAGSDVSTAGTVQAMGWTQVILPESQTSVTRLQVLSPTGLPNGFSRADAHGNAQGGTVYVLGGSITSNLACIYRLSVGTTDTSAVTTNTVQVIPDYFVESTTSPFVETGAYRNYSTNLGALITASESSPDGAPPIFEALPPFLRTGVFLMPRRTNIISPDLSNTVCIGNLLRNSGLGALILTTNTGMRVLE